MRVGGCIVIKSTVTLRGKDQWIKNIKENRKNGKDIDSTPN